MVDQPNGVAESRGDQPAQGALAGLAGLAEPVPIVGKFVSAFLKAPKSTKGVVAFCVIIALLYPAFVFFGTLEAVGLLPEPFRSNTQAFIVEKAGIPNYTDNKINKSNLSIDGSIPLSFTFTQEQGPKEQYYVSLEPNQRASFKAYDRIETEPVKGISGCEYAANDKIDSNIGQLTVEDTKIDRNIWYKPMQIAPKYNDTAKFGEINKDDWININKAGDSIEQRKDGSQANDITLQLNFVPDPRFQKSLRGNCDRAVVYVVMDFMKLGE